MSALGRPADRAPIGSVAVVVSVVVLLVCGVTGCAPSTPEEPPWERLLEERAAEGLFQGVVAVRSRDAPVRIRAFGWADVENRAPLHEGSVFRIGSLSKPITAILVLLAEQQERLTRQTLLCDVLPNCPSAWREVRIEHLLAHTSGIADRFGDLAAVPVEETADEVQRLLAEIGSADVLAAEPGAQYRYSNFNYVLLAQTLEQVYGRPWNEILQEQLARPLQLDSTAYDDVWAIVPGRAHGYARGENGELRRIEYDDHAAYAAGGLLSTAEDLLTWSGELFTGKLVGEELTRNSFVPRRGDYGLGWQVRTFFDRTIYNHTGGIDGFSSHLAHYPAEELTLLVLSSVEDDSALLTACDLAALWFAWREPPADVDAWDDLPPRVRCGLDPE